MAETWTLPLYITISVVAFIMSKMIMAIICYRRWNKQQMVIQDSFTGTCFTLDSIGLILFNHFISKLQVVHVSTAGGKLTMFRSPKTKSVKPNPFLKKMMKLSNNDVIGLGGYGTVYRLIIDEDTSFAVKRLNRLNAEQDRGFERELEAMGDIKHRNIVTLHGYYTTPQYNFLVYELVPNGSLYAVLHGMHLNHNLDNTIR